MNYIHYGYSTDQPKILRSSRRSRRDVVGTALWVTWTPLRICGVSGGSRGGRDADLGGFVLFLGDDIYEERM